MDSQGLIVRKLAEWEGREWRAREELRVAESVAQVYRRALSKILVDRLPILRTAAERRAARMSNRCPLCQGRKSQWARACRRCWRQQRDTCKALYRAFRWP